MPSAYSTRAISVGSPKYLPAPPLTVLQARMQVSSAVCPRVEVKISLFSAGKANSVAISSTVILFCVSVPVLSEQKQVQLPSVSTAESLRTTAQKPDIRCTPMARIMVTTAPIPSGIAATATATADITFSRKLDLCASKPPKNSTAATESTVTEIIFPSFAMVLSNGEATVSERFKRSAIFPISVFIPVATTTQRARPATQNVEKCAVFSRSASTDFLTIASRFFTGRDSPVSADSSQRKFSLSKIRQSAGIISPSSISTISPTTRSHASIKITLPSRTTLA